MGDGVDDGPLYIIVVLGPSLPSSTKKRSKRQSWTPSDKTLWIRAWYMSFFRLRGYKSCST